MCICSLSQQMLLGVKMTILHSPKVFPASISPLPSKSVMHLCCVTPLKQELRPCELLRRDFVVADLTETFERRFTLLRLFAALTAGPEFVALIACARAYSDRES